MNTPSGSLGRVQAALLFLPLFLLAWPYRGSILVHDVVPQATGIGFVALTLLPAAVLLLVRGAAPAVRGSVFLLLPILAAVTWISTDRLTDTFEASRTLMHWIVALVCLVIGASLPANGRRWLAFGAVLVSLALIGFALFDEERAFTGALGNTGNISEAAVAGALVGLVLAIAASGMWRIVGAVAFGLFLVYTARVPVLAGSCACIVAIAALAASSLRARRRVSVLHCGALVLASIALIAPFAMRAIKHDPGTTPAASNAPAGPAGGVGVRLLVWRGSLAMLADNPIAGVGTGQFAACFPAYRLPEEIERTTYGRRIAEESEVEHPHNDWLAPWLEGGVVPGLAWTVFLALAVLAAFRALRATDVIDVALAAAALGLLANAFVRGPLLQNPVSSPLAFALFGALLVRDEAGPKRWSRRLVVIGAVLLLASISFRAVAFVRHGFALQRATVPGVELDDVGRAVADALAVCPDSVIAASSAARISEGRGDGAPFVLDEWMKVLELRPQRIEALMQVGNRFSATDVARARASYQFVILLDPTNPGAMQNLGTLELNAGRVSAGLAWFDRLPAHRAPTRAWIEQLAARLALRGVDDAADALFARADPMRVNMTAEQCFAVAKESEARNADKETTDAWKARAQRRWGRENAAQGNFADAVRSYRQDLHLCEIHVPVPRRVKLELAAALWRAGKLDEARLQAAGLVPTPEDLVALPDWARETLRSGFEEAKK